MRTPAHSMAATARENAALRQADMPSSSISCGPMNSTSHATAVARMTAESSSRAEGASFFDAGLVGKDDGADGERTCQRTSTDLVEPDGDASVRKLALEIVEGADARLFGSLVGYPATGDL